MIFRDYVAPQSMLNSPSLVLEVVPPSGWQRPGRRWMAAVRARGNRSTPRWIDLQLLELTLHRASTGA